MSITKRILYLILLIIFSPLSSANPDQLNSAINQQDQINKEAETSQKKINKLADQSQRMLGEFKQTLRETSNLKVYNNNLEKLLISQKQEIQSLNKQYDEIETTNQGIVPLMIRMIDSLATFIDLDVPFLMTERKNRIAALKELMVSANITTSEKYRRVMEAYQIETDYGRTIEAYRGTLNSNGQQRTVEFLRIGRITFLYQTLDGNEAGVWDQPNKKWNALSSDYLTSIRKSIQIAKKQAAPELLMLPVSATKVEK